MSAVFEGPAMNSPKPGPSKRILPYASWRSCTISAGGHDEGEVLRDHEHAAVVEPLPVHPYGAVLRDAEAAGQDGEVDPLERVRVGEVLEPHRAGPGGRHPARDALRAELLDEGRDSGRERRLTGDRDDRAARGLERLAEPRDGGAGARLAGRDRRTAGIRGCGGPQAAEDLFPATGHRASPPAHRARARGSSPRAAAEARAAASRRSTCRSGAPSGRDGRTSARRGPRARRAPSSEAPSRGAASRAACRAGARRVRARSRRRASSCSCSGIFTGHTSSHEPHRLEANASEACRTGSRALARTAPMGPGMVQA